VEGVWKKNNSAAEKTTRGGRFNYSEREGGERKGGEGKAEGGVPGREDQQNAKMHDRKKKRQPTSDPWVARP